MLRAGNQDGDLRIEIRGKDHNELEVVFRVAGTARDSFKNLTFNDATDLHCYNRISLAQKNKCGTFAVLHGSTVTAYGWNQSSGDIAPSDDITVDTGYPVRMTWLTSQILRMEFGPSFSNVEIRRFQFNGGTWDDPSNPTPPQSAKLAK